MFYISLNNSPSKKDIKNLRYGFLGTHFNSNIANFQRNWTINKGAESFEKVPPIVVHSYSTAESKKPITQENLPKLEIYDTLVIELWIPVTYPCFLCIFTKMGGSLLYFNAFLKCFPAKCSTFYFAVIGWSARSSFLHLNPCYFYWLQPLYRQH